MPFLSIRFIQWFAHKKSFQTVCTCILCAPLSIPGGSMDPSIGWVEKTHKAKARKCWLKIVGFKLFHIASVSVIDTSRSMLEFGRRTRRKAQIPFFLSPTNFTAHKSSTKLSSLIFNHKKPTLWVSGKRCNVEKAKIRSKRKKEKKLYLHASAGFIDKTKRRSSRIMARKAYKFLTIINAQFFFQKMLSTLKNGKIYFAFSKWW